MRILQTLQKQQLSQENHGIKSEVKKNNQAEEAKEIIDNEGEDEDGI